MIVLQRKPKWHVTSQLKTTKQCDFWFKWREDEEAKESQLRNVSHDKMGSGATALQAAEQSWHSPAVILLLGEEEETLLCLQLPVRLLSCPLSWWASTGGSPCNHHLHHHLPQNEAEWHRWPQGIAFKAENRQKNPQKPRKKKRIFFTWFWIKNRMAFWLLLVLGFLFQWFPIALLWARGRREKKEKDNNNNNNNKKSQHRLF